jgi:hypothetical protein
MHGDASAVLDDGELLFDSEEIARMRSR